MSLRVRRHHRMVADLVAHYEFLGKANDSVAEQFISACEGTISRLAKHPEIGAAWPTSHPDLSQIRLLMVDRFHNYIIFYRVLKGDLEILRVLHGSQDYANLQDFIPRGEET